MNSATNIIDYLENQSKNGVKGIGKKRTKVVSAIFHIDKEPEDRNINSERKGSNRISSDEIKTFKNNMNMQTENVMENGNLSKSQSIVINSHQRKNKFTHMKTVDCLQLASSKSIKMQSRSNVDSLRARKPSSCLKTYAVNSVQTFMNNFPNVPRTIHKQMKKTKSKRSQNVTPTNQDLPNFDPKFCYDLNPQEYSESNRRSLDKWKTISYTKSRRSISHFSNSRCPSNDYNSTFEKAKILQ